MSSELGTIERNTYDLLTGLKSSEYLNGLALIDIRSLNIYLQTKRLATSFTKQKLWREILY